MCGLNLIYAYHPVAPEPSERELLKTRDHMHSRGPDDEGMWFSVDGRCAFAHRRLAIIDLDHRAAQPMVSRCGRYVIVFNGEIYNYRELREELLRDGAQLRTESDTEVLLELFVREGVAALPKLIGMFAFAIRDEHEKTVWLARDTYGIKPLYYADDGWTVRAASQVKALVAGEGVSTDPEPAGIVGFYLWGSVPEPFTLYQEIRAVPPGHVVKVGGLGPEIAEPFLNLSKLYDVAGSVEPDRDAVRAAVRDSIQRHLVADVPVGLFLSAGIDSSALLAGIHDLDPERAAATTAITLGFSEYSNSKDDEVPLARDIAARYGAHHHTRTVGEREFRADLPRFLDAMDQPSIDGINTWFVSKAAHEAGLKVVLSGVGGDELFAGYPSFRDVPKWRKRLMLPSRTPGLPMLWRALAGRLGSQFGANPKLAGLLTHGGTWAGAYLLRRGLFLPHELNTLLDPDLLARGLRRLDHHGGMHALLSSAPKNPTARVSMMESALYMRNQLLRDADWASMNHSLELRTPLVDVGLLRKVAPMQHSLSNKSVFAAAMDLAPEVRDRPKSGFTTPVAQWIGSAVQDSTEHWARTWARRIASEFRISTRARTDTPPSQGFEPNGLERSDAPACAPNSSSFTQHRANAAAKDSE